MNAFPKFVLAILMAGAAALASAQDHQHAGHGPHEPAAANVASGATAAALTEGEVKKIDRDSGKITLRHGAIGNLGMPAMTMVLRVRDAAMLDAAQVGDSVLFAAERVNGAITIVQMRKAQ